MQVTMLLDPDRSKLNAGADAYRIWDLIAPWVLEAAAKECERHHDPFSQTDHGRGINAGFRFAAAAIRGLKGTR